jgi:hypothetical protein
VTPDAGARVAEELLDVARAPAVDTSLASAEAPRIVQGSWASGEEERRDEKEDGAGPRHVRGRISKEEPRVT